ncbi:hypothetical protein Cni_G02305 [Canna indica]|uniref:UBA domain-containing protein n=1 Tax=Canna indica TaxID=4628 RepID=A0AAQ3JS96_9LILI|nr:hypothetical protein Cni_G02305 [Canna indica]
MSPASKSKSKDKLAAKAAKEQSKISSKPSAAPIFGSSAPSSAYNPDLGTFHSFDTTACSSLPASQQNAERSSTFGMTGEFDSMSNHNGYSGEPEDHKEKTTSTAIRIDSVPGCDTDKREKIRQKNERKHQRQKERRAQELHERCTGYLMSRKLEMLAQKIVAMGFSTEQATMALIQNEGRVEESVAWLLELSEESKQQIAANVDASVNMKIDITTELAKISDMVTKFKCMKQEVERAVVACEGDLEKAEETLKAQKQELTAASSKLEETGDTVTMSSLDNKMAIPAQNAALRPPLKGLISVSTQQRRDERDLNYNKSVITGAVEPPNKNLQSLRRTPAKPDWGRPQVAPPVDKRWSTTPSISYPLSSSLQVAVSPTNRYVMASNEPKPNLPSVREPVIVMQRPQSVNSKQNPASTSLNISASPPVSTGWYSNGIPNTEMIKVENNGGLGHNLSYLGLSSSGAHQFAPQNPFPTSTFSNAESFATGWARSWNSMGSSTSSLAAPYSLGLFTGWGSSGASSGATPVDWSSSGSKPCDYTSIDWSLDTTLLRPSAASSTWSTMFMGGKTAMPVVNAAGGVHIAAGLQENGISNSHAPDSSGSQDWSSPFAGEDLFSVPRKYVTNSSP